jgi:hypothetical protein
MGFLDDVADFVEDTASDIGDAAVDAVETAAAPFVDTAEAVVDTGGDIFGGFVDTFTPVIEDVGAAAWDVGSSVLTTVDDMGGFDAVNAFTLGAVDLSFEDGQFNAGIDLGPIATVGIGFGEQGFDASAEAVGQSVGVSYDGDSFAAQAEVGIDFGPLPHAEGEISVDDSGNFGIEGEGTLYVPTPAGLVGGTAGGYYQETDEGFETGGHIEGGYISPAGVEVKAGASIDYGEDAEGYHLETEAHGEVGIIGGPHVGAGVGYEEGREGDVSYQGVHVEAEAGAYGAEVGVSGDYQHVETPEGEFESYSGSVSASAAGVGVEAEGGVISGPDGTTTYGSIDVDADAGDLVGSVAGVVGDELGVDAGGIGDQLAGGLSDAMDDAVGSAIGAVQDQIGDAASGALEDALSGVQDKLGDAASGALNDALSGVQDQLGEAAQGVVRDVANEVIPDDVIPDLPDIQLDDVPVEQLADTAADTLSESLNAFNDALVPDEVADAIPTIETAIEETAQPALDAADDLVSEVAPAAEPLLDE